MLLVMKVRAGVHSESGKNIIICVYLSISVAEFEIHDPPKVGCLSSR